ncbi:MAG TPA: NUDIX domain-containing protein [Candidatus Saccharimonadales bacterium]|nr:NUDIX domain-containing protein [Candidatus Saccharimonadales bacterium]
MAYPPVVVVDEHDREVGAAMTAEVWEKGLYHRIVSVFVLDARGQMLLQRRSVQVKAFPGCWDQAAGGHVDAGHGYDDTAALELAEETGLQGMPLETVATYRFNTQDEGRTINQFVRVYVARVPHGALVKPAADEVGELRWFTPAELCALAASKPQDFTPGFLHELREYFPEFLEGK